MLTKIETPEVTRNPRKEKHLWNFAYRYPTPLGCTRCPDRDVCGGLQIAKSKYDCLDLCCGYPETCDAVCRKNPEDFARRVREINGFSLENVPRTRTLVAPNLAALVPVIFHGKSRRGGFNGSSTACLPLYKVIDRADGRARYTNAQSLVKEFGVGPETDIILTGTDRDAPLERWWSLGTSSRRDAIRALLDLRIAMVTTPNFSLFTDQPRWDDMHSMKRIAIVHEEFLSAGLPAALHVNARTERDWERWSEYIAVRSEISHIAFEFGTGAGRGDRMDWHLRQLVGLAGGGGHPLHLVVRGGSKVVPLLAKSFTGLTVLNTSVFVKTMKRQQAKLTTPGTVEWVSSPTDANDMLDDLLANNWRTVVHSYRSHPDKILATLEAAG